MNQDNILRFCFSNNKINLLSPMTQSDTNPFMRIYLIAVIRKRARGQHWGSTNTPTVATQIKT